MDPGEMGEAITDYLFKEEQSRIVRQKAGGGDESKTTPCESVKIPPAGGGC